MPLAGKPMIEWSIDALRACDSVAAIVVAVPPGRVGDLAGHPDLGVAEQIDDLAGRGGIAVVPGGASRAESVANALEVVGTELVVIHDAARPLLTAELVAALVALLVESPEAAGAIAAAPVTDTVKEIVDLAPTASRSAFSIQEAQNAPLAVARTLDRARLWAAQTPQLFRAAALREALAVDPATRAAATDEAMLVEASGGTVLIHPSGPWNLKVTTPLDLRVAELLLASVADQQPDQHRREAELADPEGDAEADGAEQPGDRGAGGKGKQQEE